MLSRKLTAVFGLLRRPRYCALAMLGPFVATYLTAYWLRFDGRIDAATGHLIAVTILWVVALKTLVFAWCRVYHGWGRLVTFHDLVSLGRAVTVSSLLIVLVDFIAMPTLAVPRSVVLLDWGSMIVVVGGLRSFLRLIQDSGRFSFHASNATNVLIVGANDAGETLLRILRRKDHLNYAVVGFVDDDPTALGTHVDGVPVIGKLDEICFLAVEYDAIEVLITAGQLSGKQVRHLVEAGRVHGFHVKVLPSYEQLLGGGVDVRPRHVAIDDLLRREPVQLDLESICQWIDGSTLMVTGSAGSIGSEIARQLLRLSPKRLVLVDRSENGQFYLEREIRELAPEAEIHVVIADITDHDRTVCVFRQFRPDIVFHAAAYKHVPLMQANATEAVKNIVLATRNLADVADRYDVRSFVMISTDKAVNPTSVMGACKRLAEEYVQSLTAHSDCRFVTVRFGNVLDSAGSVVPIFRQQIARGGPVTVTHPDVTRFFMTIPEASQLVIQAGAMGQGGEIFVLDMGEPIRIVELATDMIRLSGLAVGEDIEIEYVGLRPGERLREELYAASEQHVATPHSKIMVAVGDPRSPAEVRFALDRLQRHVDVSNSAMIALLGEVLPSYRAADAPMTARIHSAA